MTLVENERQGALASLKKNGITIGELKHSKTVLTHYY